MDMRRLVGKNLTRLRDERNMTQKEIAAISGISQQYLSSLERGKRNPTVITIYQISLALNVDPMEFLRRIKKPKD
ncbi:transcriptional regulator (plasmid) [Roseibium algicola]|jgi:transcriptional regulator with XRE-family HTH domain|uniref:Transcriptional regulator n=1 Tax=Roseibium algicola TaxID=2857014 RepID=A0ABM6ICA3_9HYPH|nr:MULTISPECIES: helix-turn-helix transcriptional regulator [Stappiaceae]AMN56372.1 transcriptional regulator [Labrenzia sp. CP4]AQQ08152.1 transcriptional regulator [Roseibium aggregatum]MBO9463464.1 helix-turn-helix transcriptional regulator [Labrenzia sp. R5_0]